ncbi:glutathione transferase [Enterobacterales bacterium CwR94]|nr:glutathione transferase [Enterobacterales bacterium CwR94]
MLTRLNHITLAVSDVDVSFAFYVDVLGFTPQAKWQSGAYLSLGSLWFCLSVDRVASRHDYTHYAFSLAAENFPAFRQKLRDVGVTEWKQNHSEGESIYFLDPDGHQLEAHCGDMASRLQACQQQPYADMVFYTSPDVISPGD